MRILFATDGSPGADSALEFLLSLPLSAADRVTVLTVPIFGVAGTPDGDPDMPIRADRGIRRSAARIANAAQARFVARAVPTSILVRDGPVAEAIKNAAIERAEDLVLIGSRGLGAITGVLLGSTGRALARHSPVSLLVVRDRWEPPRRVLAAVDGSVESTIAMELLARLPLPANVEITLLHVLAEEIGSGEADEALAGAERALRGRRIARSIVERGDPSERIVLRAIAGAADLVVLGSHGQCDAHGLLRTSVADDVLHRAQCAVLVAKPPLAARSIRAEATVADGFQTALV